MSHELDYLLTRTVGLMYVWPDRYLDPFLIDCLSLLLISCISFDFKYDFLYLYCTA